jgi:hypothetical protein
VCGEAVCALSWREAKQVMRPDSVSAWEPLYVRTRDQQWYEVKGANASVGPLLAERTRRPNLLKYVYCL